MKVTHLVKHPEYIIFVDEVGNNTNIKYDGEFGGKRLLKEKDHKAKITDATSDAHFTVLGFTAATRSYFQYTISRQSNTLVWTSNFQWWVGPFWCAQIQGLESDFQ